MVRRGELTDQAWRRIEPLLPAAGRRSGRWRDHRQVLNGILWKLRTGAPWRDIPERYGPWKTCHEWLRRWTADDTWDWLLTHLQVDDDGQPVEWVDYVDSTVVRAHQHAAGARKRGGSPAGPGTVAVLVGEALGRSRGGLTSKIHLAVDGRGRPLAVLLTEGQAGDNPQLLPLLDALRVPQPGGPGRPRSRPDHLVADKAYSHPSTRAALRRRRIGHTIPQGRDQIALRRARGSAGRRPPAFDAARYRDRNLVERAFNRLKQWHAQATRYAKRTALYRSLVIIAALMSWL